MDRRSFGILGSEGQHFLRLSIATADDDLREAVDRIERASRDRDGFRAFVRSGAAADSLTRPGVRRGPPRPAPRTEHPMSRSFGPRRAAWVEVTRPDARILDGRTFARAAGLLRPGLPLALLGALQLRPVGPPGRLGVLRAGSWRACSSRPWTTTSATRTAPTPTCSPMPPGTRPSASTPCSPSGTRSCGSGTRAPPHGRAPAPALRGPPGLPAEPDPRGAAVPAVPRQAPRRPPHAGDARS